MEAYEGRGDRLTLRPLPAQRFSPSSIDAQRTQASDRELKPRNSAAHPSPTVLAVPAEDAITDLVNNVVRYLEKLRRLTGLSRKSRVESRRWLLTLKTDPQNENRGDDPDC